MNDDNVMRFPKARTSQLSGAVTSRHPAGVKAAAPLCDERANGGETGISPAAPLPTHPLHRTAQAALELVQTALSGAFSEDVHHCAMTIRNELVQVSLSKHDPALRDAVSMLNTNILRMAEADSQRREVWSWSVPANANLVRVLLNHALIFGE